MECHETSGHLVTLVTETTFSLITFSDLGLSQKVLSAVEDAGYTIPTPIQAGAIPPALAGRDILGIAQTGTGKTASFVLPMLTRLEKGRARARMPRTLILEPTRELAAQVQENFITYGKYHKLNIALLIGGVSFEEQNRKLERGADVLIATPGRLLDHQERGKLLLTGVEIFVIDEADRMLDMGFIPDIERIAKLIPFTRQTLFFSATMPAEIQRLSDGFLQNPEEVRVAPAASAATTVTQRVVACKSKDFEKRALLRDLIREQDTLKNAIIFCNRKRDVSELFRSLERHGFSVGALHGDMDQHSRTAMLQGFRDNKIQLLVASDVAARGLDLPDVSHVFNFDVPIHAEDYVHRIGRTGRAGREGASFTLVTSRETKQLDAIEKLINQKIAWHDGDLASASGGEEETPKPRTRSNRSPGKSSGESGGRKSSGASGGRSSSSESVGRSQRQPSKKTEEERPEPVEMIKQQKSPATNDNKNRRGGRRSDSDDSASPVGFGDEIPAFMMIGEKR